MNDKPKKVRSNDNGEVIMQKSYYDWRTKTIPTISVSISIILLAILLINSVFGWGAKYTKIVTIAENQEKRLSTLEQNFLNYCESQNQYLLDINTKLGLIQGRLGIQDK
jgi:hypothetical protein